MCGAGETDKDGNGTIEVAGWKVKCAPGPVGRRCSGYKGSVPDGLPNRENTCTRCVGLSTFALPKMIRNALRCGTGMDDIDMISCHVQMQLRKHRGLDIPCTNKSGKQQTFSLGGYHAYTVGKCREYVKTMLNTIRDGQPAPKHAGEWVVEFEKRTGEY